MKWLDLLPLTLLVIFSGSCDRPAKQPAEKANNKIVVYQVFTRLFGNTNTTNKPWGTIEENGVGKFNDFTDKALSELKALGITHIWFTGVPHHALVTDYSSFGIPGDDPDVVKGRAGSPYAVKDYYNVDPDMAVDPSNRLNEFRSLIARTHQQGLKVIIDIVPNHVARNYCQAEEPEGKTSFGKRDDVTVEYVRNNNFYYIPGQPFQVPDPQDGYLPLGGEKHPLADGKFAENPAKWTGNGSRNPKPSFWDWYETVKLNFGIKPDGSKDFDTIPGSLSTASYQEYCAFWQDKTVPDTWKKFREIALFWIALGVDGFRYDMAEMVPVEFWNYLNSSIKNINPDAFLLAEIYNPSIYREYIHTGKMDFLYDKVDLYDTLKSIIKGKGSTDHLPAVLARYADVGNHMLHFMENHDEQRIASPEFAGNALAGIPAMVLSATVSTSPVMIYFGQEVGEPGAEKGGFGSPSRTSIFDYVGVPHHQRWMNNGQFDGGQLTTEEKELRDFYSRLLNFTTHSVALDGEYREIHSFNRENTQGYTDKLYSFVRWNESEKLLVICNFDAQHSSEVNLSIPEDLLQRWNLRGTKVPLTDQLYQGKYQMVISSGSGKIKVTLKPLESLILKTDSWSCLCLPSASADG